MGKFDKSDALSRVIEGLLETPDEVAIVEGSIRSAFATTLARKEEEARRSWRNAEADRWREAREQFEGSERIARPAIGHGWKRPPTPQPSGWGQPQHA